MRELPTEKGKDEWAGYEVLFLYMFCVARIAQHKTQLCVVL